MADVATNTGKRSVSRAAGDEIKILAYDGTDDAVFTVKSDMEFTETWGGHEELPYHNDGQPQRPDEGNAMESRIAFSRMPATLNVAASELEAFLTISGMNADDAGLRPEWSLQYGLRAYRGGPIVKTVTWAECRLEPGSFEVNRRGEVDLFSLAMISRQSKPAIAGV